MTTCRSVRAGLQGGERVVLGGAGVDDQRLARRLRQLDLRVERTLLVGARRVVAEVVQAGLADGRAARVGGQRLQVGEVGVVEALGVVGVTPDGGVDLREVLGRLQRRAVGRRVHADGEDAVDALARRGRDQLGVGRGARVQVRVAVVHGMVDRVRAADGRPSWGMRIVHPCLGRAGRARRPRRSCPRRTVRRRGRCRGAEGSEELLGRPGDPRGEQHGDHAQALGQRAQDAIEVGRALGVLGQLPRRLLLDVAVEPPHALPDVVEGRRELDAVDALGHALGEAVEVAGERRVDVDRRHRPVAVAPDHRQRAVGEVAQLVGQLGLVAALEGLGGDRAVLAEGDVAQQVVAQGVGPEALDDLERDRARCPATCSSSRRPSAGSRGRRRARAPAGRPPSASPARRPCGSAGCPCR